MARCALLTNSSESAEKLLNQTLESTCQHVFTPPDPNLKKNNFSGLFSLVLNNTRAPSPTAKVAGFVSAAEEDVCQCGRIEEMKTKSGRFVVLIEGALRRRTRDFRGAANGRAESGETRGFPSASAAAAAAEPCFWFRSPGDKHHGFVRRFFLNRN